MSEEPAPTTASVASVLAGDATTTSPSHVRQADMAADPTTARRKVRATGVVKEVGISPAKEQAQFTALLMAIDPGQPRTDAKPVRLVWQGQRAVPGVTVGVSLDCVGLLCHRGEQATIFNPRYEIVAKKVQR